MLDFDKLIEVSGLRIKLNEPLDLILRIHITFSIAPAKMKISFFIFTHTKYIYLKRRINLLHNHGTHKKNGTGEKNYQTLLWQLSLKSQKVQKHISYENFIIRNLRLHFLTQICVFYCKKCFSFTYYSIKIHIFS